jgi:uncharacterized protein (DUF427 family)
VNRDRTLLIRPAAVRVRVNVGDVLLADSNDALLLDEPGHVRRYYLPRQDVRMDLLQPSAAETTCPLKGVASYWSYEGHDATIDDVAWSYEHPIPAAEAIANFVSFYPDRVEMNVEGDRLP